MKLLQQAWLRAANAIEGTGRTVHTINPAVIVTGISSPDPSGLSQDLSLMFGAAAFIGGCAAGAEKMMHGQPLFAPKHSA